MSGSSFEAGAAAADRERFTPAQAADYLRACETSGTAHGRNEYDRGFMARVREIADVQVAR